MIFWRRKNVSEKEHEFDGFQFLKDFSELLLKIHVLAQRTYRMFLDLRYRLWKDVIKNLDEYSTRFIGSGLSINISLCEYKHGNKLTLYICDISFNIGKIEFKLNDHECYLFINNIPVFHNTCKVHEFNICNYPHEITYHFKRIGKIFHFQYFLNIIYELKKLMLSNDKNVAYNIVFTFGGSTDTFKPGKLRDILRDVYSHWSRHCNKNFYEILEEMKEEIEKLRNVVKLFVNTFIDLYSSDKDSFNELDEITKMHVKDVVCVCGLDNVENVVVMDCGFYTHKIPIEVLKNQVVLSDYVKFLVSYYYAVNTLTRFV